MRYYLDTEFHEYHKQVKICGILLGKPIPTIDLISIGIVSEDEHFRIEYGTTKDNNRIPISSETSYREYYAISKDFNLKDAWNSWQEKPEDTYMGGRKDYWLRENVLKPIYSELFTMYCKTSLTGDEYVIFSYNNFKHLLGKYGKTNKEMAEEIKKFASHKKVIFKGDEYNVDSVEANSVNVFVSETLGQTFINSSFEWANLDFYAYNADYDWVVFCQLFGKMIDLPKVFPMYCKDLKQILGEKILSSKSPSKGCATTHTMKEWNTWSFDEKLKWIEQFDSNYPKQENEHNALADAIWNKELHKFINTL